MDRRTPSSKPRCSVVLDAFPYEESLLAGKQRLLMDAGLFHSRRSRVGWSCDWTLAHSGTPLSTPAAVNEDDDDDDDNGRIPSLL